MIIAAYMNDQPLFDDLWKYSLAHAWTYSPMGGGGSKATLLMNWYISSSGNIGSNPSGSGAATDADEAIGRDAGGGAQHTVFQHRAVAGAGQGDVAAGRLDDTGVEGVVARIGDDGLGIDEHTLLHGRPDHFGLPGMQAHAQRIGAQIAISGAPGEGTRVLLRVKTKQPTWRWWKLRRQQEILKEAKNAHPVRGTEDAGS